MHILICISTISARSWASCCNPRSHCSCSNFVGGKPCSALLSGAALPCVLLPTAVLSSPTNHDIDAYLGTGYIPFPSCFSASHPKVGEEGQTMLFSIPGLNLTSHAPWPFPYSPPEVNGAQEIRVFSNLSRKQEKIFATAQPGDEFFCFTPSVASLVDRLV